MLSSRLPTKQGRAPTRSAQRPKGFLDYALGKINPQDKDYGTAIEVQRSGVVQHTIDDLYFWSNVVTLLLLCGLAAVVLFQWRCGRQTRGHRCISYRAALEWPRE